MGYLTFRRNGVLSSSMQNEPTRRPPGRRGGVRPPRGRNRFTESEFARACRVAQREGAEAVILDPATGTFTARFGSSTKTAESAAPLDTWMAARADQAEGH
jgi:hypothetical protein